MRRVGATSGIVTAVLVLGAAGTAWSANVNKLPWHSPSKVTSGVAVHVASIKPCPAPPNPGDPVLVEISVAFGRSGGASTQILPANSDGSWAGDVTFGFSGQGVRQATMSATCLDDIGVTGVPYANYQTHHTQVYS